MATAPAAVGFQSTDNKRYLMGTVLILDTSGSSFNQALVKLASGANGGPIAGVTVENFVEPNYYSYATGDDPTAINGSTPTGYDISKSKPVALAIEAGSVVLCLCAGTVAAGDLLLIGDAYGRVDNLANLSIAKDTVINPVGVAQSPGVVNAFVEVRLSDFKAMLAPIII